MKRSFLVFACFLVLSSVGSRTASAQSPQGATANANSQKVARHHWWNHREKVNRKKNPPLYNSPKSVGWWHHRNPGPVGAGTK